jgi:GntP family gluconate:H+ symporter
MTGNTYLLSVFLLSIAILLYSIIKLKVNPFLALLGVALLVGVLSGMSLDSIPKQLSTGFGQTLAGIGIVIGLGVIFGKILEESAATGQIAQMFLGAVGKKLSPLSINLTGYLASISVFFDAGFVIFMPLLRNLSRSTGIPLISFVTAMAVGLIATHCLVIPTPGPLAAMSNLQIEPASFLLYGLIVALPAAVAGGWMAGMYIGKKEKKTAAAWQREEVPEQQQSEETIIMEANRGPSGGLSLMVLLLPILLILIGSLTSQLLPKGASGARVAGFIGDKNVALLAGVVIAFIVMRPYIKKSFDQLVTESAAAAGPILLITGAGGAFGSLIGASGISNVLVSSLSSLHLSLLLLGFLLCAILRAAQGSATVAIVTASSILAKVVGPAGAHPLTVGLAICCGGMCGSFPNDSGFWVVSRFGGLSVPQTLKAWTLCSTIGGITGLLITLVIDKFI